MSGTKLRRGVKRYEDCDSPGDAPLEPSDFPSNRESVQLTIITTWGAIARLEALRDTGLYGSNVAEVADTLMRMALREEFMAQERDA